MVMILNNTQEINLKQFFPIFLLFWPYDVILTPKTALFGHFGQIFADISLLLNYNTDFAHKTMVEIVQIILMRLKKIFTQDFIG